ncbi:hypothetical protein GCM10009775_02880 [Microbacterium aoyamense]|uniref:Uncharacterized protein n=1 Tax=Microbacterium aoyamense TaxID=344166 RepID=A0ABN2P922_9MICO|nr:hypothetical protein [Microbacterium aoyamense]
MTPSPAATEAATTAAAIDPTLLVLLPIIGVFATILGGFLGAWIQGRREHRKWKREKRYEAYVRLVATLIQLRELRREEADRKLDPDNPRFANLEARLDKFSDIKGDLQAPYTVLGPRAIGDAFALVNSLPPDSPESIAAWDALVGAMRKELDVDD